MNPLAFSLLGAEVIGFSILCTLLCVIAYTQLLRAERRRKNANALANTEEMQAALAAIEDQRGQAIASAQAAAARIIADARSVAARVKAREISAGSDTAGRFARPGSE